ncbi:MAG: T9SS type A sorting domain-containing protein [Bacteroidales bacterium]|nr:T9SS type A sorting domain-containing protein [Bacteroidales bacterium]
MKTFYIAFLLFFNLFTILNAQVTIQQSSLPAPGDTFAYIVDQNPSIAFNYIQTNATWNFTALQNDTVKYASYGITSQLPFASNFPNSNLYTYGPGILYGGLGGAAPYYNNFGHMLFASNNTGFYTVGFRSDFGFGMTNVLVQPNELLMKVPFAYNDSVYQESSWEINYNAIPTDYDTLYKRYNFKTLVAKGYGTLITPYGTFNNCLAVEEYLRFYDTIYVKYGTMTLYKTLAQTDTMLTVHVWSENKVNALLTAYYNPQTLACTAIEYLNYEDLNHVEPITINEHGHLYPNPVKAGENCSLSFPADAVSVTTIDGKISQHISVQNNQIKIPQNLKQGEYILTVFKNNKIVHKSPLIIRNE